ncbi:MAG: acyltransferase domain-containing protein [Clostridiales bacterium]|jgi:[acyl-carrier-protein] S-malonyltransferase|nr:acyltransferase domain-containing protein [Clostridiales bacterium]
MDGVKMMKYVLVFSGQGSEHVGMFNSFLNESDDLEWTIEVFKERIGLDISNFINSNDREVVAMNNQILLYVYHQIVSKMLIEKIGFSPILCMGHSFGQFSALVNSGTVAFIDMAKFIVERTKIINSPDIEVKAVFKSIHGITIEAFNEFQEKEGLKGDVELALHNQKEQIVVAVTEDGKNKLNLLSNTYNYVIKAMNVSRPYHTIFMEEYNSLLLPYIKEMNFKNSQYPVFMNNSTRAINNGQLLLAETEIQMTKPVFWYESIEKVSDIIDAFFIIDPGETQFKIIKRISDKRIYNVNNMGVIKSIEKRGF